MEKNKLELASGNYRLKNVVIGKNLFLFFKDVHLHIFTGKGFLGLDLFGFFTSIRLSKNDATLFMREESDILRSPNPLHKTQ